MKSDKLAFKILIGILSTSLIISIVFNVYIKIKFEQVQSELIEEKLLNIDRVRDMARYEMGYDHRAEIAIGRMFYALDSCLEKLHQIKNERELAKSDLIEIHQEVVQIINSERINHYHNQLENIHKNKDHVEWSLLDSFDTKLSIERHVYEDFEYGFMSLWRLVSWSNCRWFFNYEAKMHVDSIGTTIYISEEPKDFHLGGTVLKNIKINSKEVYTFPNYVSTISPVIWEIHLPNQFDKSVKLSFEHTRLRPQSFEAYEGDSALVFDLRAN